MGLRILAWCPWCLSQCSHGIRRKWLGLCLWPLWRICRSLPILPLPTDFCLQILHFFFFWEVGLNGNIISDLQTDPDRPWQFPVRIEGETEAQGRMSGLLHRQLGWGLSPWVLLLGFCSGLSWVTSQLHGLAHHFPSGLSVSWYVKVGMSAPASGLAVGTEPLPHPGVSGEAAGFSGLCFFCFVCTQASHHREWSLHSFLIVRSMDLFF